MESVAVFEGKWAEMVVMARLAFQRTVLPAIIKTAIFLAVALDVNAIVNAIKKDFTNNYGKIADFAKCMLTVEQFLRTTLDWLGKILEAGDDINAEITGVAEEAEEILKACLSKGGGGN